MSSIELNRGNKIYDSDLSYPLKFLKKIQIAGGHSHLDKICIFESNLYASARYYLICYNLTKNEVIFEKIFENSDVRCPIYGEDGKIYLYYNDHTSCLDVESGEVIWKVENDFYLLSSSNDNLFCRDSLNDPDTVCCISQKDGRELWQIKASGGYSESMSENGITIISSFEKYLSVEETTGKILWQKIKSDLFTSFFPNKECRRVPRNGPLIDGVFIVAYETGDFFAIEAKTGDIKWQKSIDNIVHVSAGIYFNKKLFFPIDHKYSNYEYILCLDFETGELIHRSGEFLTKKGCVNPIITNGFLVGGEDNQIGFYDLEKQKVVHRQEFKGKDFQKRIFSTPLAYKKQLIAWDMQTKEVYFFSSE